MTGWPSPGVMPCNGKGACVFGRQRVISAPINKCHLKKAEDDKNSNRKASNNDNVLEFYTSHLWTHTKKSINYCRACHIEGDILDLRHNFLPM